MAVATLLKPTFGGDTLPEPVHVLSLAELADGLGSTKAEIDELENRLAALRAELLARKQPVVTGKLFRATVSHVTSWRLDQAKLKNEFGPDWIQQHSRLVPSTVVRVSSR
jgi:uncharacterized small protein (DUF1192 family)